MDEVGGQVEVQQTPERFARHGARNDIAAYYNLVNLGLTNLLQHSLQGGEIPMHVIERSNPHPNSTPIPPNSNSRRSSGTTIRYSESHSPAPHASGRRAGSP